MSRRLIDADALKDEILSWAILINKPHLLDKEDTICVIDNAPTVDAVELPCKIGDYVWAIRSYRGHKHPQRGIVGEMFFTQDMKLMIVIKHVARGVWGEKVFATYEEAQAAIAREKA